MNGNNLDKEESHFEDDETYFQPCLDPSHNPPMHLYIPPGQKFVHICPNCGNKTIISGNIVTF